MDIINDIIFKDLFKIMFENGFDLRMLCNQKKLDRDLINIFNENLRLANKKIKVDIFEFIIYISENFSSINTIVNMLDENNKQKVKREMSKKFNITIDDSLSKILKWK
jgi:hypothetical protein